LLEGLHQEVRTLILLGVVLLIVGFTNGHIAETLIVGGIAYTFLTLSKIQRLYRWLASDKKDMPPEMSGVWGDISDELYRLKQQVEQSKKNYTALALRIRQITTALDDGMILLNANRALDWWNPSAAALLNLKEGDRGEIISNLIRDPEFVKFILGDSFSHSFELRAPHDPTRVYHFSAGIFGRGEVVLMVRDITRLRRLEEMRKEFVANVSHELRTPLTVLMGYIETLASDANCPPNYWQKALAQMDQQTRRLKSLTEDLIMLSRLESTPPQANPQKVDLGSLLASVCDSAKVIAGQQHNICLDCKPELVVLGQPHELQGAFSNLLFNAIRHNPRGCDIRIRAERLAEGVIVEVADTGIGIEAKHLPRLTERFYRVDDSRTSSSGGTGLGLAIVKHVLARHQAQLEIRSTLGKGSTFTCIFRQEERG